MLFEKKHILKLKRKRIGENRNYNSNNLYLDRNERSQDFDSKFYNKFKKKIKNINRYPNLNQIYKKLSNFLNIDVSNIFITDGVAGGIRCLIELFTKPKYSNIIYFQPSFALYDVYADLFQLKKKVINYKIEDEFIIDKIISLVDQKTAIIFFPIPDNPIAKNISIKDVLKLISFCEKRKILIAIDEVYIDYGYFSFVEKSKQFKYLVVLRSFSKSYGAAGIRFGFIISSNFINNYLSNYRSAYESNTLSILFAETIIENIKVKDKYVKEINLSREKIKQSLINLNLNYHDSDYGNYIYIYFKNIIQKNNFINYLKHKKIFIRDGWGKNFNKGVSLTLSDIKTTNKLIKHLSKFEDLDN